jgi:hypothetical protein
MSFFVPATRSTVDEELCCIPVENQFEKRDVVISVTVEKTTISQL